MRFTALALATLFSAVLAKPTSYYKKDYDYNWPVKAVVVLTNDSMNTTGTVTFTQYDYDSPTEVYAKISGLVPGTKHGFHVHETGDLSGGCDTLGLHFNPFNQDHGSPFSKVRHVADFGNIEQEEGEDWATLTLKIPTLRLTGPTSIIGRGLVLHSGEDDLGLGDSPLSKTVGNSGGRLACGIVGIAAAKKDD